MRTSVLQSDSNLSRLYFWGYSLLIRLFWEVRGREVRRRVPLAYRGRD